MRVINLRSAVTRCDRKLHKLIPERTIEYDFNACAYVIRVCEPYGLTLSPILPKDILGLMRHIGALKQHEREDTLAMKLNNGDIIGETPLPNLFKFKVMTLALRDMLAQLHIHGYSISDPQGNPVTTPVAEQYDDPTAPGYAGVEDDADTKLEQHIQELITPEN